MINNMIVSLKSCPACAYVFWAGWITLVISTMLWEPKKYRYMIKGLKIKP